MSDTPMVSHSYFVPNVGSGETRLMAVLEQAMESFMYIDDNEPGARARAADWLAAKFANRGR